MPILSDYWWLLVLFGVVGVLLALVCYRPCSDCPHNRRWCLWACDEVARKGRE